MRILLAVTSAKANYGGPAVSVSSLACALAAIGHSTWIWSPDGSAADVPVCRDGPIGLGGQLQDAIEIAGTVDLVHDSGIWMPHNHAIARLCKERGICRIVSPRGMLSPWARRHKGLKKAVAWQVYQRRDLNRAQCMHATSEEEKEHLASLELRPPVICIPNGLLEDAFGLSDQRIQIARRRQHPRRIALFLGRIAPVKGLLNLVRAWERIRPTNWLLKIVGPNESGHRDELQKLVRRLGIDEFVVFQEAVSGNAKMHLLRECDLFILPSFSESFGMAVAEALAAGLPVITTKAAPWAAIERERLGWWVAPSESELTRALRAATTTGAEELEAMGRRGETYVRREFSWTTLGARYDELYREVVSGKASRVAVGHI